MPTPADAARQCLTQEAAAALDEAVAVARRRGHPQTTSLHMISSLFALPNSFLREACTRTRNNGYSGRVQFRALELSLRVSLDRLPSSQGSRVEEPPVSNSLMAAIKRSQASQRRQPENFTFYQQQQQQQQYSSCSSVPVVKVELRNLIVSILDDPLVSRVFAEAGFRSCDIKMATLRPGYSFHAPHLFGYVSRYKRSNPPLPWCNFTDGVSSNEVRGRGFSFPFLCGSSGDENSKRIGEIMMMKKKRNPLLLGVPAGDALRCFLEAVQIKKTGEVLPEGLYGLKMVCLKDEISRYLNRDCDEGPLTLRFEEVGKMLENATGTGVVMNIGDLKALAGDSVGLDALRYLVTKLGQLLEFHAGKLWLIGAAATYEVYFKILNKFPTLEEDWDLAVLPITSFSMGPSYPRSRLMESFVPLGGFFSSPPETKSPSSHCTVPSHLCNEKYEQEVAAPLGGGIIPSVAEQFKPKLPSWLQQPKPASQSRFSPIKCQDEGLLVGHEKQWDSICKQDHSNSTFAKEYTPPSSLQFTHVLGFQVAKERREHDSNISINDNNGSSHEDGNRNVTSSLVTDLRVRDSPLTGLGQLDMLPQSKSLNILPISGEISSELKRGRKSQLIDSSSASSADDHSSPTSVTSVTTDLRFAANRPCIRKELEKPVDQIATGKKWSDWNDSKKLYRALVDRVGRQEEAISAIVETYVQSQAKCNDPNGVSQRNIWINVHGPDRFGKKRLGLALAEEIYGSTQSLIYVDLSFQDEKTQADNLFKSQLTNKYGLTMRRTVMDYLVEKVSRKPCLVFLENIDKADMVIQSCLYQAVKSGRLSDLHGREVNIKNCIFLGTTMFSEDRQSLCSGNEYTEDHALSIEGNALQISIGFDLNDDPISSSGNKRKVVSRNRNDPSSEIFEGIKRAHKASKSCPDLNLPAEICNDCSKEPDSDSSSEHPWSWLEDFEVHIDKTVVFKPIDFHALSEKLCDDMSKSLHNLVGSESLLDIEPKAMHQILAATYLFGNRKVEDWIQQVVRQAFEEAKERFGLNLNSCSTLKLVTCVGSVSEGLLPGRIIIR